MVNDKTRVDLKMEAKRFINKHRNIQFLSKSKTENSFIYMGYMRDLLKTLYISKKYGIIHL